VQPEVASFITEHFIPVRIHVQRQGAQFKTLSQRYSAPWTPTTLVLDSQGEERHRIEGFLPAADFLAQIALGLAHAAFAAQNFERAESLYRSVVDAHGATDAAPEALYWAGVSAYKASNDPAPLAETAWQFSQRYKDSAWAKKASVWQH